MNRNDVIVWFGRLFSIAFSGAMLWDLITDGTMSQTIRQATIGITGLVFLSIFLWQARIAYRYEGIPTIPMPFRWVVAAWMGSMALLVAWNLTVSFHVDIFTEHRSAVMWWQFAISTVWFGARWVTVDGPHLSGTGETGAGGTCAG
jgi:hypothetical protein